MKSLTYCDLQGIELEGFKAVLKMYPEFSERCSTDLLHDLTYNLREGFVDPEDAEATYAPAVTLPAISEEDSGGGGEGGGGSQRPPRLPIQLSSENFCICSKTTFVRQRHDQVKCFCGTAGAWGRHRDGWGMGFFSPKNQIRKISLGGAQ